MAAVLIWIHFWAYTCPGVSPGIGVPGVLGLPVIWIFGSPSEEASASRRAIPLVATNIDLTSEENDFSFT